MWRGLSNQLLQIDFGGPEGALGLAARAVVGALHSVGGEDGAHALAATAGGCLEHDRVADFGRDLPGLVETLQTGGRSGNAGHPDCVGSLTRPGLGTEGAHRRGGWTDELDSGRFTGFGEVGVLRKKAITGMKSVGAALSRYSQHQIAAQVGVDRGGRTEAIGFASRRERAERRDQRPSRPRPNRSPARGRRGRCAERSLRGSQSGSCGFFSWRGDRLSSQSSLRRRIRKPPRTGALWLERAKRYLELSITTPPGVAAAFFSSLALRVPIALVFQSTAA